MTGIPWDQPGSDPVADMQEWMRQYAQPSPYMKRLKVTSAFYRRIVHEAAPPYPDPLGLVYGVPVVIDNTIPASPGYQIEWSA